MKLVLVSLMMVMPLVSWAQLPDKDTLSREHRRKGYHKRKDKSHNIIDYSDVLNVKFFGIRKSNLVDHHDGNTRKSLHFKPNENINLGFGIGYKWLELDLAFNFAALNEDDHIFGRTEQNDLQLNLYLHKFVIDANYQSYRGYYWSNVKTHDDNFSSSLTPFPRRPDMRTRNIGFSAFYVFDHEHFSYRAAFNFNEKQRRSAGSFIAGAYYDQYQMDADSVLIPGFVQANFDSEADFRGINYTSFGLAGGYAHTFVIFKYFFLSGSVALGLGPQLERREPERRRPGLRRLPPVNESAAAAIGIFRGSIGYSTHHYFAGLTAVRVISGNKDDSESHLKRELSNFKFFIGIRLVPPKFLKPRG